MAKGSKPDFHVFATRGYKDGKEDKTYYTRIGAAWKVANDGVSIQLDALPVDGSLVMFPPKEE